MFTNSLFGAFVFATNPFSARIVASSVAKQNLNPFDILMFPGKPIIDTLFVNSDEGHEQDMWPRGGRMMIHRGSVSSCGMDVNGAYKIGGEGV
jgi:hypothetical protein